MNIEIIILVSVLGLIAGYVFAKVQANKKANHLKDIEAKQNEILIRKKKLREQMLNAYKYKNIDFTKQSLFLHVLEGISDLGSNFHPILMPYIDVSERVSDYYDPRDIAESLDDFFQCDVTMSCEKVGKSFLLRITSSTIDLSRFESNVLGINNAIEELKKLN